jgi:hypothetical protein
VYVLGSESKYGALAPDQDRVYHSTVLKGFDVSPRWLWPGEDQLPDVRAALQAMGLR